ncbi:hypothetical protein LTS08_007099 [Lithohypha guttulata]|nr:hypothetical protein LTS08_007099 [Lithohypha guttulata]
MLTESSSMYGIDESLSSSDQEMFALFLRYPEIDFDADLDISDKSTTEIPTETKVDSSPISVAPDKGSDSDASTLVDQPGRSPTLSTPVRRFEPRSNSSSHENSSDWASFMHLMQQSDLPAECLHYYTCLGEGFVGVGAELFGTVRLGRSSNTSGVICWLLKNVTYSCDQATMQIEQVANLKTLVAFNSTPSATQLWSTYLQRAKLIVENLALPSKRECDLIGCLVFLYDAHIYNEVLQVMSLNIVDDTIAKKLHMLYDKLMSWHHKYKQWCHGMRDLKNTYIQPLIEQYSNSKEAQEEFNDFQERTNKASAALEKPAEEMAEMTENVVKTLNLSARRPGASSSLKRSKTRYKREHTM